MKRAVILLGAGATLGWGGKTTNEITQGIITDKKYLTIKGEPLAGFIHRKLVEYHGEQYKNEINFEHIINALESIADYAYQRLQSGSPPQFTGSKPIWFDFTEALEEMRYFTCELIEGYPGRSRYKNSADNSSTIDIFSENGDLHHFIDATKYYIYLIRGCIARYDNTCLDPTYKSINDSFYGFYTELKQRGYTVRFYSTNYDDIIPKIIGAYQEKAPFNGYDDPISYSKFELTPNIKRVLTDYESDVHYNLHGNIFWDIVNHEDRAEMTYVFKIGMPQTMTFYSHSEYTNPAESTNMYNIVTGFNKLQKVSMEPLRSFANIFSMDCIKADLVISIGYSYSDPHINRSLKNAIDENNARFVHITYTDSFFGSAPYYNMQRISLTKKAHYNFKPSGEDWFVSNENDAFIYKLGYEKFLESKSWLKFL